MTYHQFLEVSGFHMLQCEKIFILELMEYHIYEINE